MASESGTRLPGDEPPLRYEIYRGLGVSGSPRAGWRRLRRAQGAPIFSRPISARAFRGHAAA